MKKFNYLFSLLFLSLLTLESSASITEINVDIDQMRPTQFAIGRSNAQDMEKRSFSEWVKKLHKSKCEEMSGCKITMQEIFENWEGYNDFLQKMTNEKPVEAMTYFDEEENSYKYFQLDGHHRTYLFTVGQKRVQSIFEYPSIKLSFPELCGPYKTLFTQLNLPVNTDIDCTNFTFHRPNKIPKLKIRIKANDLISHLKHDDFYLSLFKMGKMLLPPESRRKLQEFPQDKELNNKLLNLMNLYIPKDFQTINDYPIRSLVGNVFYNSTIFSDFLEDYVEFYFAEELLAHSIQLPEGDTNKFEKNEITLLTQYKTKSSLSGTEKLLIEKARYIIFNTPLSEWFLEHTRDNMKGKAKEMINDAKIRYGVSEKGSPHLKELVITPRNNELQNKYKSLSASSQANEEDQTYHPYSLRNSDEVREILEDHVKDNNLQNLIDEKIEHKRQVEWRKMIKEKVEKKEEEQKLINAFFHSPDEEEARNTYWENSTF